MSYSLLKPKDSSMKPLDTLTWRKALDLAERHGWTPAGTTASDMTLRYYRLKWFGDYYTCEFQWVTDSDARNLGDALARALEGISDTPLLAPVDIAEGENADIGRIIVPIDIAHIASPEEWFSGSKGKADLQDLIEWCWDDGFLIT